MNARRLCCERCAAPFTCSSGDPAGCWCAALALTDAVRSDLQGRFGDCLCAACLREVAVEDRPALSTPENEQAGAE